MLIEAIHNIVKIISSKKATDTVIFVAVAGLSRSGKSTFIKNSSEILTAKLFIPKTIELDHWILPASGRNPEMTVRERYQYNLISNDISALIRNGEINFFPYDSLSREIAKESINLSIKGFKVVFFDGVIALDHPLLNNISNVKIFIEIDEEIRKKRFRDFYRLKGCTDHAIESLYLQRMKDENDLVSETRTFADIVIRDGKFIKQLDESSER